MEIALVGLGKMGAGLAQRLTADGHKVYGFDQSVDAKSKFVEKGGIDLASLSDLKSLQQPRRIWVMLPAGDATNETLAVLLNVLGPGDYVIDGGNSRYDEAVRWSSRFAERGIQFLDVGVSGGVWGLAEGFCLMIGGEKDAVRALDPLFLSLAPGRSGQHSQDSDTDPRPALGYAHCGPAGAGHFVKMIHNGIEYGMMQAFAEGFELLQKADHPARDAATQYDLDVVQIAELWRHGSVIRSWLLDLGAEALKQDPNLDGFDGHVSDSGEARWTLETAIEEEVATPVIAASLFARFRSRTGNTFGEKLLSAFRKQFGGHVEPK